jgi:hypothetical protein
VANISGFGLADLLGARLESPITLERNTAIGLVIGHSNSCVGVNGFVATKHPKKHQNGHICRASITTYKRLLLTQEVHKVKV